MVVAVFCRFFLVKIAEKTFMETKYNEGDLCIGLTFYETILIGSLQNMGNFFPKVAISTEL